MTRALPCANFREFRYDAEAACYRAVVDVAGVQGLFRKPILRTEPVHRAPGSGLWYYTRTGKLASLAVAELEAKR